VRPSAASGPAVAIATLLCSLRDARVFARHRPPDDCWVLPAIGCKKPQSFERSRRASMSGCVPRRRPSQIHEGRRPLFPRRRLPNGFRSPTGDTSRRPGQRRRECRGGAVAPPRPPTGSLGPCLEVRRECAGRRSPQNEGNGADLRTLDGPSTRPGTGRGPARTSHALARVPRTAVPASKHKKREFHWQT
jgi:hypothetical protein